MRECVCECYLYIWCMGDELGEFDLIEKLSHILNVWLCINSHWFHLRGFLMIVNCLCVFTIFVNAWFG